MLRYRAVDHLGLFWDSGWPNVLHCKYDGHLGLSGALGGRE